MKKIAFLCFLISISSCISTLKAQVTNLSSGQSFQFLEGPVWDGNEFLYFTDIPNNAIVKYSVLENTFSTVLTNSNRGNGLMFNIDMNLIVCEGTSGKIIERTTNGDMIRTIVSTYDDKRFNSPNDLCIDAIGGIYFTDPTWATEYQPKNRVYYLNPEGVTTMLIDDMQKPNGVLLSIDGKTLYVNDSWSNIIRAYDVLSDGTLTNQRDFGVLELPANTGNISGADGMATDIEGNLYVTSDVGLQIFDKNGNRTQIVNVPEKTTNCTFGGVDKKTLFITAEKNLYSLRLAREGFQHPFDLPGFNLSVRDIPNRFSSALFFPNPVHNHTLTIDDDKDIDFTITDITLFDLNGRKISNLYSNSGIIKFDNSLVPGTYLLRMKGFNNQSVMKKIIIE